jgi:hypothetical protein
MTRDCTRGEAQGGPVLLNIADEPTSGVGLRVETDGGELVIVLRRWDAGRRLPGGGTGLHWPQADGATLCIEVTLAGVPLRLEAGSAVGVPSSGSA